MTGSTRIPGARSEQTKDGVAGAEPLRRMGLSFMEAKPT